MRRKEIVLTYVVIVLFIVIGIGYAYLEEDLSLQNNVTLTNYSAVPEPVSFATDSWSTIVANVASGNTSVYAPKAGTEVLREVDLGTLGTHYLRVANTTDCTTETSKSACGFVVEFADIITTHRMNPYSSSSTAVGNGNIGGWKNSEMRTYVNNDIYNALPAEIKNSIIKTKVISSHGNARGDSANLESEDYLYLLSTKEVWGKNGTSNVINYDTADSTTRQLDYYSVNGVTTSSYSKAIKKNNGSASYWWLRSARSGSSNWFYFVDSSGDWSFSASDTTRGVSPAFRIGKTE